MKLQAESGNEKYEIEIVRDGAGVDATINGKHLDVEVSQPEPNLFLLKQNGQITEAFVVPEAHSDGTRSVWIKGREHLVKVIDPKRLRGSASNTGESHGLAEIRTAMPGKVVRVLSESGTAVEKGDGIVVVEAMKMQNELKAPKSGVVKAINVSAGDTVSAGDVLATIE